VRSILGIFIALLLPAGCAPASARTSTTPDRKNTETSLSVQLDNGLKACVELATEEVESVRNVVVLGARMRMLQSLAACGCKTALLGYRVRLDDPWRSGVVGRFDTNNRPLLTDERVYLLLSTDAPLLQQARTANIQVSCGATDSVNQR